MYEQYRSIQLTIEDLNNQKILIGNDVMWFDGITKFGEAIGKMVDIGDIQKKELLKVILKKIVVDYDNIEKVHLLVIHFRLPVIIGDMGSILTSKILLNSSSTIGKAPDQLFPLSHYSTVTKSSAIEGDAVRSGEVISTGLSSSSANIQQSNYTLQSKGYALLMSVELRVANLWCPPYNTYQKELFDIITKFHDQGMDFKQISDWLNHNGYKTPRGKTFMEQHAWSIYTKKIKSIRRFGREFEPRITNIGADVVDFIPNPT